VKEHIKVSKFVKSEQDSANRYEIAIFHKLLKIQRMYSYIASMFYHFEPDNDFAIMHVYIKPLQGHYPKGLSHYNNNQEINDMSPDKIGPDFYYGI
jgi:hypothetical protein